MKPKQQIAAVAKLAGYSLRKGSRQSEQCQLWYLIQPDGYSTCEFGWTPDEEVTLNTMQEIYFPDYLTSHNAIIPVIAKVCDTIDKKSDFIVALKSILHIPVGPLSHETFSLVVATPAQLAEALLRSTREWLPSL